PRGAQAGLGPLGVRVGRARGVLRCDRLHGRLPENKSNSRDGSIANPALTRDFTHPEGVVAAVTERYFDHHTTQPLVPAARRALEEALDRFGDPLRMHERGRTAHRALDEAREAVAHCISAQPDEIVFTSGRTESV